MCFTLFILTFRQSPDTFKCSTKLRKQKITTKQAAFKIQQWKVSFSKNGVYSVWLMSSWPNVEGGNFRKPSAVIFPYRPILYSQTNPSCHGVSRPSVKGSTSAVMLSLSELWTLEWSLHLGQEVGLETAGFRNKDCFQIWCLLVDV